MSEDKLAAAQHRRVRAVIAQVRAAAPNAPAHFYDPTQCDFTNSVAELGELFLWMVSFLPPEARLKVSEQAARDVTAMRLKLDGELRAGSKTAGRLILGLFGDRREGEH